MLTPQPNQYTPLDIQKGVIDMPARIDTQGYVGTNIRKLKRVRGIK